jgi:hypothetical protein
MKPRWFWFAVLALSVALLDSCSKTQDPQIAACRGEALTTHPPPRVTDYASFDRMYWNEQKVEDDVVACVERNGWQYAPWLRGCVSGSDMSRQSACYYRNDVVARLSRWMTGAKPPEPPPHSIPVPAKGQKRKNIVIAIDKEGNVYWDGKRIEQTELRGKFLEALKRAQAEENAK